MALPTLDVPVPPHVWSAHGSGNDPQSVLLYGEGPIVGSGVIDHELGLTGHVARALPAMTGRGSDVYVQARAAVSLVHAREELARLPLERFDAVVLCAGAIEVGRRLSRAQWATRMTRALDVIETRTDPAARIVVLGIRNIFPGFYKSFPFPNTFRWQAERFNQVTREITASRSRVDFVELGEESDWREAYPGWGDVIASALARHLALPGSYGAPTRTVRDLPQPEAERQLALDRLGVLDTPADPRIDSVVALARTRFGTEFAAVELIDHDRAWHRSAIGAAGNEIPRNQSFCATTIQRSGALVVGDARTDPRFASLPSVRDGAIRFYAGHPIEAADGSRVGTLCVADPHARALEDFDVSSLRDLALMVQRRLRTSSAARSRIAVAVPVGTGIRAGNG